MVIYLLNIVLLFSLTGNDFQSSLKKYLEKQLSMYNGFEYEIVQMPKDYSAIEIISGTELQLSGNRLMIPVLLTKESTQRESHITVKLRLYKNVATAINKVESRKDLTSSDFELKNLDVSLLRGTPFSSLAEINSFRTKIALNPGTILIHEVVEEKPVIQNGDLVKARFINGNVTVSIEANARQEGAVGEIIRIVTRSKKQYKAKVVDSSNVNILE